MATTDRYGHDADGRRPSERVQRFGYDYCLVAENIGYQYNSTGFTTEELAPRFVEGWKNSLPHRQNMLDPDVHEIGVAVARSENTGYWYGVQILGRPKSAAIEFQIENRSDAAVEYTVDGRTFPLPPRYARTHLRCRPAKVAFGFREQSVEPVNGSHYTIIESAGQLELRTQDNRSSANSAERTLRAEQRTRRAE
jgi:hypothetical protein